MVLERLAAQHGEAPALLGDEGVVTFAALAERIRYYAHWGLRQGIGAGDVVALVMPNCSEYLAIWLGISRIGGVVALMNCNLAPPTLAHSLKTVRPRHIVVAAVLENLVIGALAETALDVPCWGHGETGGRFPRIDQGALEGGAPLGGLEDRPLPSLSDPALLIFTSGTTGYPKAAYVSHGRVVQWSHWFAGLMGITPQDRLYNCLPMYHSIGGVVAMGAPLVAGASVVIRERFSATRFWDEVISWECTIFQYIGELCRYLVRAPHHPNETAHKLRLCCGNGLRADVWDSFKRRFEIPQILEYYAATEASFSLYNVEGRSGAIGRIPGFLAQRFAVALIRIEIETGAPLRNSEGLCVRSQVGEAGEAISRIRDSGSKAGGLFEGYTDAAASDRKILRDVFAPGDAWYRSGDLMRQDAEGFFYFVDRLGETFRWKGENVATAEVTTAILACPGIVAAVVYGVHVPGTEGRAGMAALVTGDAFDLVAFRQKLAASLPDYACPRFLRIRDEIEMTSTFRPRAVELAREGFDPQQITDALYVDDRDKAAFVSLDAAIYREIEAERFRL